MCLFVSCRGLDKRYKPYKYITATENEFSRGPIKEKIKKLIIIEIKKVLRLTIEVIEERQLR